MFLCLIVNQTVVRDQMPLRRAKRLRIHSKLQVLPLRLMMRVRESAGLRGTILTLAPSVQDSDPTRILPHRYPNCNPSSRIRQRVRDCPRG